MSNIPNTADLKAKIPYLVDFYQIQSSLTKRVQRMRMIALAIGSGLVWMESRRTTVMD
jgi:hypothetical protein